MTETNESKKPTYVKWVDPPADYKRKFKGDDYITRLGDKIKGSEFLDGFIQDICRKDMKFQMSPKQEAWLAKIEFTFLKELEAPRKNFGEGTEHFDDGLDQLSPDKIPF